MNTLGQIEVYNILKDKRASGDDSFYSIPNIIKGIKENKLYSLNTRGVWAAVCTLENYGYLNVKTPNKKTRFRRLYRLKKKYIK